MPVESIYTIINTISVVTPAIPNTKRIKLVSERSERRLRRSAACERRNIRSDGRLRLVGGAYSPSLLSLFSWLSAIKSSQLNCTACLRNCSQPLYKGVLVMRKLSQSRPFGRALAFRPLIIAACTVFGLSGSAFADNDKVRKQVKGEALKAVFSETTMIGEYRLYRTETETYNYTEFHSKDGSTDYIEGDQLEKGIWTLIGDDKICYRYPRSDYYTQKYCFFVFNVEGCYYKFSLRQMSIRGPRNWDRWSSRAIRKGSGKSCAVPTS